MATERTFNGARIVVAGATGGLGSEFVRQLYDAGADVIALGRDEAKLDGLPAVKGIVCDLADPSSVHALANAIEGPVDGLVNAAGVVAFGSLADTDDEVLDQLFAVNTLGPLRLTRTLLPSMADGGFVVTISGVVAEQPMGGLAAYSASKTALAGAATALRRELRRQKVDVIDMRPPHTETGLSDRAISGTAPAFGNGADPTRVVARMLEGILSGVRELASDAFSTD